MSKSIRIWMDGAGRLILLRELREAIKEAYGDAELTFFPDPARRCITIRKASSADPVRARVARCGMNTAPRLQLPVDMVRTCSPQREFMTQRHVYVSFEHPLEPDSTRFFVWF